MILKAYGFYFDTVNEQDMQDLYNLIYDKLVDDYEECGILVTDQALHEQVLELIEDMKEDYDELWEEHA